MSKRQAGTATAAAPASQPADDVAARLAASETRANELERLVGEMQRQMQQLRGDQDGSRRVAPDDPIVHHESPGLDVERKKFGKYHGLDPWDTATLLVSQPGSGRVYDAREMPQSRPGFVVGEDGREFEIGPNVVAVADTAGKLFEPGFTPAGQGDEKSRGPDGKARTALVSV